VNTIILLNPAAGRGRARRRWTHALEFLQSSGERPEVWESQSAQNLLDLARQAAKEKPDLIVSAGGDGTHHYVINGLAGSDVPLGLLSLGSGNDLAHGLGIPTGPAAVEVLLLGVPRSIDLARVYRDGNEHSTLYACIAGAGFDSIVTRFANQKIHRVHGPPAYAWAILRCLKFYGAHSIEIRSDTEGFAGDVIFVTVGNSTSYGGGVKIAPRARLDDGLLDVCVVPAMSRLELLRWMPAAYRGQHLAHPRIRYFQAHKVTVASASRLELFGDGEFVQELPATIEVVPRSLRVMVPKTGTWDSGFGDFRFHS